MVALAKATPKIIYYRDETAQKLIQGINTVADVVKVRFLCVVFVSIYICVCVYVYALFFFVSV